MAKNAKKILIVEDDKDFLSLLQQSFNDAGLSLITAMDGEAGLELAEKENPDLILIDINLPKMDGLSMAKAIKEKGITSQMIFLTNLSDSDHIGQAIEIAGQADYVIKSDINMDGIVEKVKRKLGLT